METDLSIARKGPIPKLYGRIADDLRRRILSGEFTDRIPGEREIARAYEAHVLTANKAVTALVKEGLLRRVRGVGAFVTRLRRPRTMVLAAVVGNVERPLHGRVVRGMEAAARERGQHLLFANHLWSPEREEQSLRRLIEEERVDGFLVWPTDMRLESPGMQRLLHSGIPFVVFPHVGRDRRHDVSVVLSDDAAGARLAVRHLIDAGHRRIGIVILSRRGGMAPELVENRLAGFSLAHAESGLAPGPSIEAWEEPTRERDAALLAERIRRGELTALFCITGNLAIDVMRGLAELGVRTPDNVSIVGLDGAERAEDFSLTTVDQPMGEVGEKAVHLLLEEIEGRRRERAEIVLVPRLIERRSVLHLNCARP